MGTPAVQEKRGILNGDVRAGADIHAGPRLELREERRASEVQARTGRNVRRLKLNAVKNKLGVCALRTHEEPAPLQSVVAPRGLDERVSGGRAVSSADARGEQLEKPAGARDERLVVDVGRDKAAVYSLYLS